LRSRLSGRKAGFGARIPHPVKILISLPQFKCINLDLQEAHEAGLSPASTRNCLTGLVRRRNPDKVEWSEGDGVTDLQDGGLADEIMQEVRRYVCLRRVNGFFAEAFIWLTIAVSFILAIVTATYPDAGVLETKIKWIVILSPLPGIFGIIRTSVGFHHRAAWFSEKATRINTVRRRFAYGSRDRSDAVRDLTAIDVEMEGR
jgi:hypothetical protein